jgi:hypothetical protein
LKAATESLRRVTAPKSIRQNTGDCLSTLSLAHCHRAVRTPICRETPRYPRSPGPWPCPSWNPRRQPGPGSTTWQRIERGVGAAQPPFPPDGHKRQAPQAFTPAPPATTIASAHRAP